jgi:hypothetical protein
VLLKLDLRNIIGIITVDRTKYEAKNGIKIFKHNYTNKKLGRSDHFIKKENDQV